MPGPRLVVEWAPKLDGRESACKCGLTETCAVDVGPRLVDDAA